LGIPHVWPYGYDCGPSRLRRLALPGKLGASHSMSRHRHSVFGSKQLATDSALEVLRSDAVWCGMDELFSEAGFRYWSYAAAPVLPSPVAHALRVTTYPREHVKQCIEHDLLSSCPGLSFAFRHTRPALFKTVRANTPTSRKFRAMLELNREHGVTRGIVIPLRDVFGMTGMIALEFEGTDEALLELWRGKREFLLTEITQRNEDILARHGRCFTRGALPDLPQRRRDVIKLLAQGLTTRDVADTLHISIDTINKHTAAIKHQLGTRTTAQTTALAARWGLI
jgi:DNA-binding CsgD family transcriptional regulator